MQGRQRWLILHPKSGMRRFLFAVLIIATGAFAALTLEVAALAGVVGVFQGRIVQPKGAKYEEGVLFIRARNGMARKVRVAKAVIEFDEDVPRDQRRKAAAKSLCEETLVRVTAEQSDQEDGEWKAINILILADPNLEPRAGAQASLEQKPDKGSGSNSQGSKGKAEALRFCAP